VKLGALGFDDGDVLVTDGVLKAVQFGGGLERGLGWRGGSFRARMTMTLLPKTWTKSDVEDRRNPGATRPRPQP